MEGEGYWNPRLFYLRCYMPYVEVDGVRLFYALHENEAQNSIPLILIHGAGGSRLAWPAALRRLSGMQVLAVDLPGHGKSGGSACSDVGAYTKFVVRLLDTLRIERAVFMGHSMGGAIAQQLAITYPTRTAALILIATGARLIVSPQILELTTSDHAAAIELILENAQGSDTPEQLMRLVRQQMQSVPAETLRTDYLACDSFDGLEQLRQIHAPALVIGGSVDQMTPPKYASYLAEHIPRAELVMIEGAGHMPMLEREVEVGRAVERFLRAQKFLA